MVFVSKALDPTAVLLSAVVFDCKARFPIPVLESPVVLESNA